MLIPIGDQNKRNKFPVLNYLLLSANISVFFLLLFNRPQADYEEIVVTYGMTPESWHWTTVLTSMFLHADLLHLFGNMLMLWIMGDNVEDRFGSVPYLIFYVAAGAAACGAQAMFGASPDKPMIGASGAIAGVMGAYLLLFPKARIVMLLWVIVIVHVFTVPSWIVIFLYMGLDMLRAWQESKGEVGPVAVWAHLGGFFFGLVVALFWYLLRPFRSSPSKKS